MLAITAALLGPSAAVAEPDATLTIASTLPASAQSTAAEARDSVELDADVARALQSRPGARLLAEYRATTDSWIVHVREPVGTRDLVTLTVADDTLKITGRQRLPRSQYPPRLTERRAIVIARADAESRRMAREFGGMVRLRANADWEDGTVWEVSFWQGRDIVLRVDIDDLTGTVTGRWTGWQIAWSMARGDRYAFGGEVNRWYVFWPLFALFALVMIDRTRLRRMLNLDVVMLLSLGLSHELFNRGRIEWSVPLAVPPLVYLGVRMTWLFVRGVPPATPQTEQLRWWRRAFPVWALVLLTLFAGGVRYGIEGWGSNVTDVGYAGVAGARLMLDGTAPWGNMPADNRHGDTYGPANYALYVPGVLLEGDDQADTWAGSLPAARVASIGGDLACIVLLVLIGVRWFSRRAGALLAAGWVTCPWTAWTLTSNSNDLIVAALVLAALLALPRAWLRGLLIGVAASVKFVPLLLLAVFAHVGRASRARQIMSVGAGAAIAIIGSGLWIAAYDDGIDAFVQSTFGFQLDRESPFSVWGMHGWRLAQIVAQGVLLCALVLATAYPRVRDARQVAAGAAATLIGLELVLQHWFYLYIVWFVGPLLVVWVAMRESRALPLESPVHSEE